MCFVQYIYVIEMNLTILSANQMYMLWLTVLFREFLSIDWYAGDKEIFFLFRDPNAIMSSENPIVWTYLKPIQYSSCLLMLFLWSVLNYPVFDITIRRVKWTMFMDFHHACYVSCPSHAFWLNVGWMIRIVVFSVVGMCLISVNPKYCVEPFYLWK